LIGSNIEQKESQYVVKLQWIENAFKVSLLNILYNLFHYGQLVKQRRLRPIDIKTCPPLTPPIFGSKQLVSM